MAPEFSLGTKFASTLGAFSKTVNNNWLDTLTLEDATDIIHEKISSAAENLCAAGFYLRQVKDKELFLEKGYKDIWEYAHTEFGFSQSATSRYIQINSRYSKDGNSPALDEKYSKFSSSQLQELLALPEESAAQNIENAEITEDMTVKEVRNKVKEIKKQNEEQSEGNMEESSDEENLPGQMRIEDFPEYMPDNDIVQATSTYERTELNITSERIRSLITKLSNEQKHMSGNDVEDYELCIFALEVVLKNLQNEKR